MKATRLFLVALLVSAMIGVSEPAWSQQNPATTPAPAEHYDGDNDDGNWSWIGLLGLIGLAGLMGRNRDVPVTRTSNPQTRTSTNPQTR